MRWLYGEVKNPNLKFPWSENKNDDEFRLSPGLRVSVDETRQERKWRSNKEIIAAFSIVIIFLELWIRELSIQLIQNTILLWNKDFEDRYFPIWKFTTLLSLMEDLELVHSLVIDSSSFQENPTPLYFSQSVVLL